MFDENRWNKLKEVLFKSGVDAIEDFLGYYLVEGMDIDSELENVVAQMPEDVLETYYERYVL